MNISPLRVLRSPLRRLCLTLIFLVAAVNAAHADDEAEGRRRYQRGAELYSRGAFLDAAAEFEAGYRAAPRPLFLLNIAHSYRRAGKLREALKTYRTLLDRAPNLPQRSDVEATIRAIEDALAADLLADPTPPRSPFSGAANSERIGGKAGPVLSLDDPLPDPTAPPNRAAAATALAPDAVRETASPAPSGRSVFASPWFWVATGVLVAAGGVAGVLLLRSEPPCPGTRCF